MRLTRTDREVLDLCRGAEPKGAVLARVYLSAALRLTSAGLIRAESAHGAEPARFHVVAPERGQS